MSLKLIDQTTQSIKTPQPKTICPHQKYCFSNASCANDDQLSDAEFISPPSDSSHLLPTSE